jgi:hypothetical protein
LAPGLADEPVELEPPEVVESCGLVVSALEDEPPGAALPVAAEPPAGGVLEPEVPDDELEDGLDDPDLPLGVELELDELDGDEVPDVPSVVELFDDLLVVEDEDGAVELPEPVVEGVTVELELLLFAGALELPLLPLSPHPISVRVPRMAPAISNFLSMHLCSLQ